jgi:xylulose-5-phosphate/fructose-6-phosphate phosphoketolase
MDHCLRTYDRINVVIAGKQPAPQWLSMDEAVKHCERGLGIWNWASTEREDAEPDVVLACCGDVPTLESLAAVDLLRKHAPELALRFVNVVDLMTLQSKKTHPHGLADDEFDELFTRDRPVVFAYHGYPHLIHRLTYNRTNSPNIHVHGYNEEGTTTTPFDMVVLNGLDRFHLAMDVIGRVAKLSARAPHIRQAVRDKLLEHKAYIRAHGEDMPEIQNWAWPYKSAAQAGE